MITVTPREAEIGPTNYHKEGYSRGDVKFRQRALVLRFMEKYLSDDFPVRLLTLPGDHWMFELMLMQKFPLATFVGVERSPAVYGISRSMMPRNAMAYVFGTDELQTRRFTYGRADFVYSRISNGIDEKGHTADFHRAANRSNRLVRMDVNDFMQFLTQDYGASMEEKKRFATRFYHRDAVWLDYTGKITPQMLEGLRHLPMCLSPGSHAKPIVITVFNGRDQYKSKQERVEAIQTALPDMTIRRVWTYQGKGKSPMLTVCGLMR